MDNVCHSLAGAVLAEATVARRLPRAALLGVVAANIPDVDALTYLFADPATAVGFRRGLTHGLPALVLWTAGLAAAFAWWQRRRPDARFAAAGAAAIPTWRDYLPLAAIAVVSHPVLDWMNTYGIRFLAPISDEWFYGDTLFIVDLVLIGVFAAGWIVARTARRRGAAWSAMPARAALGIAIAYIVAMKWASVATRDAVAAADALAEASPRTVMVAPQPAAWSRRDVLVRTADRDVWRNATLTRHGIALGNPWSERHGVDSALAAAVRATRDGRNFLRWSRFPYFVPGTGADSRSVFVGDARYATGTTESWAGIRVRPAGN